MAIAYERPALLKELAYIDGAWTGADSGSTFDVTNPATGERIASVPRMGASETRRAIAPGALRPGKSAASFCDAGSMRSCATRTTSRC